MKDRLEERIRTNDERHDDLHNKFDELQRELYELKCFVNSRHGEAT
jgi:chaperonin cofactor prefoldin